MSRIYVFDLDGTLTESKGPIDNQMVKLLESLLEVHAVCVVSGGGWPQFQKQLINRIRPSLLRSLYCFPTCGTSYYFYDEAKWCQDYNLVLLQDEKDDILATFDVAFAETGYEPETVQGGEGWGDIIEDRGSQITFSALGQQAPIDFKKAWDPTCERRQEMVQIMQPLLPDYDVRFGGTTSIDVTKAGYNKSLAIKTICKEFRCGVSDLVFFGDALDPGGNDHAVYQEGVLCIPVDGHIDCIWKVQQFRKVDQCPKNLSSSH